SDHVHRAADLGDHRLLSGRPDPDPGDPQAAVEEDRRHRRGGRQLTRGPAPAGETGGRPARWVEGPMESGPAGRLCMPPVEARPEKAVAAAAVLGIPYARWTTL